MFQATCRICHKWLGDVSMDNEKLMWYGLLAIVIIGLLWTLNNYFTTNTVNQVAQTSTALPSKCIAPAGYTQESWNEHMGHHPDQYAECLGSGSSQPQSSAPQATDAQLQDAITKVIPRGIPDKYGSELGVSFEDPVNSMNKLGKLENSISLTDAELKRYIAIVSRISCEFCCGATSIIDRKGNPACGCAHSGAMRGLAKYLVKNHPNDYTDDQALQELVKWKTLFFPKQMIQRFMEKGKVW